MKMQSYENEARNLCTTTGTKCNCLNLEKKSEMWGVLVIAKSLAAFPLPFKLSKLKIRLIDTLFNNLYIAKLHWKF